MEINRFIIELRHENTGECKSIKIQAPYKLKDAKKIVSQMFISQNFKVENITQVKTAVKIQIEEVCLN